MKGLYYFNAVVPLLLVALLSACGGGAASANGSITELDGDSVAGESVFMSACIACHGQDAQGRPGLGKNLVSSDFVDSKSDQELVEFIKVGRAPDDPLNTTRVAMPPKGAKATLSDQALFDIVAYIRTLKK
jgi:disulfide bond formation protein DsbB